MKINTWLFYSNLIDFNSNTTGEMYTTCVKERKTAFFT